MAHDEVEAPSASGRWGGRLTARELPLGPDIAIDSLCTEAREELAHHWLQRGAAERRVGDSFAVIRDALAEHGGQQALVDLAARAVDDEVRHAELSRVVASRFAGRELAALPRLPHFVPEHAQATPELRRTLWIVGQCCLNETIASAVLEASLAASTGTLARAALRELLSDEVDHARIGWAHVTALSAETRAALAPWVYNLTISNVRTWRSTPRDYPSPTLTRSLVEHGALSEELLEGAILGALRDLVIPGFEQVGLPTARLARWVAQGAPNS